MKLDIIDLDDRAFDHLAGARHAPRSVPAHWQDYTDCCSFLVSDGGEPLAAATLIYDQALSFAHGHALTFLAEWHACGSLDATRLLTSTLAEWARAKATRAIRGPMTPFIGDERGLLVEGHELGPCIGFPCTPPRYDDLLRQCGFQPVMDMHAFQFTLSQSRWFTSVARFATARLKNVEVIPISSMDTRVALTRIACLYNEAWRELWMHFPLQVQDLERLYRELSPILPAELNFIVTVDGEDAAVFMSAPNVLDVDESSGRARSYRGMLFGVHPAFRRRGIDAVLAATAFERAAAQGYALFDIGWILESNSSWLKQAAKFAGGSTRRQRFRIYDLPLAG